MHSRRVLFGACVLAGLMPVSCYNMRQYGVDRSGTIGGLVVVADSDTGKPLEGATVAVKEGWKRYICTERTNSFGEIMFSRAYSARSVGDALWPPYLIIEVSSQGYETLMESVNTEKFLYEYGDSGIYKRYEIKLRKGTGTRRVENFKPDPLSGH
ncbi:MAG: hypothetical protein JW909_05065 [Planctomycetes bacterium]|nr:hypothetical protein [Planctomycetota bacterium]